MWGRASALHSRQCRKDDAPRCPARPFHTPQLMPHNDKPEEKDKNRRLSGALHDTK